MTENNPADFEGARTASQVDVFENIDPAIKLRTKKMMMWFIIFAVVMLFGGITSALIVMHGRILWVHIVPPMWLWWSIGFIGLSSITYYLAFKSLRAGNQSRASLMMVLTTVLGLGFVITQNAGWSELAEKGMGFTTALNEDGLKYYRWNPLGRINAEYGKDYYIELLGEPLIKEGEEYYLQSDVGRIDPRTAQVMTTFNAAGALLSVLIYVHIIHLFFGLIYLVVNTVRIVKKKLNQENWMSLYAGGMYWHFMGILWAYLFLFIFYIY